MSGVEARPAAATGAGPATTRDSLSAGGSHVRERRDERGESLGKNTGVPFTRAKGRLFFFFLFPVPLFS